MNKKQFEKGCFSSGWLEEVQFNMNSQQKKDLATLLLELEDLKKDFAAISEHKERLANMLNFYQGGLLEN